MNNRIILTNSILILGLLITIPVVQVNGQSNTYIPIFYDDFSRENLSSTWKQYQNSTNAYIKESDGYLSLFVNQTNQFGYTVYVEKELNPNHTAISIDFDYSFKGMGQMHVVGIDSNTSNKLWDIGIIDADPGGNAFPIIQSFHPEGDIDEEYSWNQANSLDIHFDDFMGNGSIFVELISSNRISVVFSNPHSVETFNTIVAGNTGYVQLLFTAPPEINYAPGDYWKFDNYAEYIKRVGTVSVNTTTTESQISESSVTIPTQYNQNIDDIVTIFVISGIICVGTLIYFSVTRKHNSTQQKSEKVKIHSKSENLKIKNNRNEIRQLNDHLKKISDIIEEEKN